MSKLSPQKPLQALMNTVIRLAPLGGSGWVLITSLKDQEWAQALIMFPVTVFTTFWAAYSEAFLEAIATWSKKQGESDGHAVTQWLTGLRQSLTQPEVKYLACQRRDCVYNDIEGYEQRNVLLLRDVFVPLTLTQTGLGVGPMGSRPTPDQKVILQMMERDDVTIWDFLRQVRQQPTYSRMVILANGGFGKTTLLRHITYTYATKRYKPAKQFKKVPKLVPVLLYLRKWQDIIAPPEDQALGPDLPVLITKHHIPHLPEGERLKIPAGWARRILHKGKALVMIDGFDEVADSQRNRVSQWINAQMRHYPKSVFLLTSRPAGYNHYQGRDKFKSTVFVQPFNPEQWKRFIHQWYVCQERTRRANSEEHIAAVKAIARRKAKQLIQQIEAPERSDLADMVTNPLLLNMIATWHQFQPGGKLPRYRADLYRSICELQLGSRPEAKQVELLLEVKDSQKILQWLALGLQRKQKNQIQQTILLKFLTATLKGFAESIPSEQYLTWVCQVSELLVERNTGEYEFAHRSFQSYLAAVEIGQRGLETALLNQWDQQQDWWHETIILYVAQLDNPNQAIQGLVDRKAADLAYKCWQETSKRIDSKLKAMLDHFHLEQQVQGLRFRALENHLRSGEWRQADEETSRLMLKIRGKDEREYLTAQDLREFPQKEWLWIDNLWRKYSLHRFGFSVQKQIYKDCGATLDGKFPRKEDWERFGDRVGWRQDGQWINYDRAIFNIQAPVGHLPYLFPPPFHLFRGGGFLLMRPDWPT